MIRRPIKRRPVKRNCEFCKDKTEPDYKDVLNIKNYLSERGKIVSKDRSGLCLKHQKRVATSVKRARHLALLPFAAGL